MFKSKNMEFKSNHYKVVAFFMQKIMSNHNKVHRGYKGTTEQLIVRKVIKQNEW